MKSQNQHKYADITHDAYINALQEELTSYSEIQGRQNGIQNKPVTEPELRAYIMNAIESKVQSALDHNHQIYLPVSGMVLANKIQADAKGKITGIKSSLAEDEHKLGPLEDKKKELIADPKKRLIRMLVYIGAGVISLAEGYFAFEALRLAGFPKIAADCAALGIAIAIGFGTHILAGYIRKAQKPIQRIIRYSIVLIPAFIGFYVLGSLRASGYNSTIDLNPHLNGAFVPQSGAIEGWKITIISFLLFVAALIFSIKYYKTEEEYNQDLAYDNVCAEIKKLIATIKGKHDEIEAIQKEADIRSADALIRYEYAIACENSLQAIARKSLEKYSQSNLRHRTDGSCPNFFSYPPVFNFSLFFDKLKTTRNEVQN